MNERIITRAEMLEPGLDAREFLPSLSSHLGGDSWVARNPEKWRIVSQAFWAIHDEKSLVMYINLDLGSRWTVIPLAIRIDASKRLHLCYGRQVRLDGRQRARFPELDPSLVVFVIDETPLMPGRILSFSEERSWRDQYGPWIDDDVLERFAHPYEAMAMEVMAR